MKVHQNLTVKEILGNAVNTPLLSNEEEISLAKRVREGDEAAIEEFKRCNARFVAATAMHYTNQGMTINELMAAGNEGLMEAAHRYDEKRGFKFLCYSVWWIRQSILKALEERSVANIHTL